MTVSETILKKMTTRNTIALATTGMMLFVIYIMITNPSMLIVTLQDHQELMIGGAVVFGVFLAKWSDMIHFFFRRSGKEPTPPIIPDSSKSTDPATSQDN